MSRTLFNTSAKPVPEPSIFERKAHRVVAKYRWFTLEELHRYFEHRPEDAWWLQDVLPGVPQADIDALVDHWNSLCPFHELFDVAHPISPEMRALILSGAII